MGHNQPIFYTFRTFSLISSVEDNVFVFSKLREDFGLFRERIQTVRPSYILGIGNGKRTQYEAVALNEFHGKKLDMAGLPSYSLYVPETRLPVSSHGTTSFCNWTAYKIAQFLDQEALSTKLLFLHVAADDEKALIREIKQFAA